jgi:hypothetical protein
MKFITINFIIFLSSISKIFSLLKCANSLSGRLAETCLIKDINNDITYVAKCKKGQKCISLEELGNTRSITNNNLYKNDISTLNLGQCVPFIMPLFVGDACTVNEECASKNCDGGKCEVPKDYCHDHLQCDYGEYCGLIGNNNEEGDHKCHKFRKEGQSCHEDAECGRFMLCHQTDDTNPTCRKIGTFAIGKEVSNEMLCKTGFINDDDYCQEITENEICKMDPIIGRIQANVIYDNDDSVRSECEINEVDGFYFPVKSRNKIEAFYDYKNKLDELYDDMENDDIMWNWNNNRYHGDDEELKTKYFFYKNPYYYGKYQKDDEDMDCIIDYLKQHDLNSSINKISKLFLMIFMLFLI